MNYITKCFKHLKLVCRHKYYVFLASIECGIPIRGFFHDMSKFSPIEFLNSAKYYTGDRSPIDNEKDDKGYSYAWLHHRGHNPHHWEYWIDNLSDGGKPLRIPVKYVKEMVCDWIGSGKAYNGKEWTRSVPYQYFIKQYNSGKIRMNYDTYKLIKKILYMYKQGYNLSALFARYTTTDGEYLYIPG